MLKFKVEHLILFSAILLIMLMLNSPSLMADDMMTISGKLAVERTDRTVFNLDDTDNHMLTMDSYTGSNYSTGKDTFMNNAIVTSYSMADIVNGSGPANGYVKFEKGKNTIHIKHSHMVKTKTTDTGNPLITFSGTFHFINGTGKYEGIAGTGTYDGKYTSETTIAVTWEGEYTLDREIALEGNLK